MVCKGSGNHHHERQLSSLPKNRKANKTFAPFRNFIPDGLRRGDLQDLHHGEDNVAALQSTICDGEMLCGLSGQWLIYQRTTGHRYSTDDVCTAFVAIEELHSLGFYSSCKIMLDAIAKLSEVHIIFEHTLTLFTTAVVYILITSYLLPFYIAHIIHTHIHTG